uniref:Uncharacterized protein n=1 Tax=Anguilla anguilla TaxID=7936 RepID=A0A0E9PVC6_ANGAN
MLSSGLEPFTGINALCSRLGPKNVHPNIIFFSLCHQNPRGGPDLNYYTWK